MPISGGINTPNPVSPLPQRQATTADIGIGDQLGAAYEEINTLGASIAAYEEYRDQGPADPNFNLWEALEPGEQTHAQDFIGAKSQGQLDALRSKRAREMKNREVVEQGPLPAWLAYITAGVPDPINLFPTLAGMKRIRQLGALAAGGFGAASNILLSEGILQTMNETRTAEESIASVLMGGFFGAGIGAGAALFKGVTPKIHKDVTDDFLAVGRGELKAGGEAISSELPTLVRELTPADTKLVSGAGYSELRAKMGKYGLASEAQTLLGSKFDNVRSTFLKLSGSRGLLIKGHAKGLSEGIPTQVKIDSDINGAIMGIRIDAEKYYKGHVDAVRGEGGKALSRSDFDLAVGRALSNDDISPIRGAGAAAKGYRKSVFDVQLKKMEEIGELPKDLDPKFALSYFSRVYDQRNMRAYRQKFIEIAKRVFSRETSRISEASGTPASLTARELDDLANDAHNRIMGQSGARAGVGRTLDDKSPLQKGPLKDRTLMIPDEELRNVDLGNGQTISFLNNHAGEVMERYVRSTASDYHFKKDWGTVRPADDIIKAVNKEVAEKVKGLGAKEAEKMQLDATREMEHLTEIIGRMRGVTGFPKDMRESMIGRSLKFLRNINFIRMLGTVLFSSIPDAAIPVMRYGTLKTMGPAVTDLTRGFSGIKMGMKEARAVGQAGDIYTSTRMKSLMGTEERFSNETPIEALAERAAHGFSTMTGLNHWNTLAKSYGTSLYLTRALTLIRKQGEGKALSAKENRTLAQYGLTPDMTKKIYAQKEHWVKDGDLMFPNAEAWTDFDAAQAFRYSTYAAVDDLVLMPGITDAPIWAAGNWGKTLTQFKRFSIAADQRIFQSGLQKADANTLMGMTMMIGMGMLATYSKDIANYGEVKDRTTGGWIAEGIDRSGIMTAFVEADALFAKATGVGALESMAGQQLSRLAPRGLISQVAGPSAGAAFDTVGALQGAAQGQFTESDMNRLSRLVPFQNYILTSHLYKQFIAGLSKQFNLPESE